MFLTSIASFPICLEYEFSDSLTPFIKKGRSGYLFWLFEWPELISASDGTVSWTTFLKSSFNWLVKDSLKTSWFNSANDDVNLLLKESNKPFNLASVIEEVKMLLYCSTHESQSHTQLRLSTRHLTYSSERGAQVPWNQSWQLSCPIARPSSSLTPLLLWPHSTDVLVVLTKSLMLWYAIVQAYIHWNLFND